MSKTESTSKKPFQKLFLFGIARAGKTSLTKVLKGQNHQGTKPTLAFNLVNFTIDDKKFQIWDAPGQSSLRRIWNNGFNRAKFMIFVLDTSNPDDYEEAKNEFYKVLGEDDVKDIPLIFCFHKMDLPNAPKNLPKAREFFKLDEITDREVKTLQTSVFDQDSINELKKLMVEFSEKVRATRF